MTVSNNENNEQVINGLPNPTTQTQKQNQHGAYPQEVPSTVPLNIPAESYHYTQPDQLNNGSIIPQQQQYPEPLKELTEYEHQYGGIAGGMYPQMAQGFPAQPTHINYQQMAQETVIMEVAQGMQIQLPNADGTNSTYFGPYSLQMQVPYGEAPPIQAPPNYQTILRHCVDQNSGAPLRIYSVVPIQQPIPDLRAINFPQNVYPPIMENHAYDPNSNILSQHQQPTQHPLSQMHEHNPRLNYQNEHKGSNNLQLQNDQNDLQKVPTPPSGIRGAETDEEKKKIKIILSTIEPPQVTKIGLDFVLLNWNEIKNNGKEIDSKEIYYILEIQNTVPQSGVAPVWQAVYTGKSTQVQTEKLQPGTEYFSRVKARYLNIEGDPSGHFFFSTNSPEKPNSSNETSPNSQKSKRIENDESRKNAHRQPVRPNPKYRIPSIQTQVMDGFKPNGPQSRFKEQQNFQHKQPLATPEAPKVRGREATYLIVEWNYSTNHRILNYILQIEESTENNSEFRSIYEGKETTFTASKLRRATSYKLRVAANTDVGQTNFSPIIEESTNAECPSQLNKPVVSNIKKMEPVDSEPDASCGKTRPGPYYTAELRWKAPKDNGGFSIIEYRLQQRITDRNQSWELKYTGQDEFATMENLPPGSRIEFRVQAVSKAGSSAWSLPELVTTKPGRPKAPKKITIENIYTRTANVTWSVGLCVTGGSVQRYELKLTETGYYDARTNGNNIHENNLIEEDARIQFKGNNKQARECKLIDLKSGRRYRIDVRTINSGSEASDWSSQEFTTLSDRPSTPDSISVTAVQSDNVSIEWKEPIANGSVITGYKVEISGDNYETLTVSTSSTRLDQKKLNANTVYKFKVAAINALGQSDYSQFCSVRTLPSIPHIPKLNVELLFNIPVVRQTAHLTWNKPSDQGSKICGYKIESRWSNDEREYSISPDETEFKVNDLQPESTYRFRIQATNERGSSDFSEWVRLRSRPLPPCPPSISSSDIQPNSVKLSWNSSGAKYMLQMEKQNSKSFTSWKEIYRGEKTNFKATRLQEGSINRFRILASNDSGDGHFSAPFEITTPRAPAPNLKTAPSVEISEVEESATIGWHLVSHQQLSDLKYKLELLRDGKIIRTIPAITKTEFKMENLERDHNYSVKVCAIRNGKAAKFSPEAHFIISKKIEKERKGPATSSSTRSTPFPDIWADDSLTALLLFAFAIVAILFALCGHHWQKQTSSMP